MALNPSIILAGAQPDILGAMSRGNELAAQTNTLRDQNALRQVYQTQGAGILSGDQNSLNALAMIDPITAINAQGGVLSNRTEQRKFEIMNAQEKRAIAEAAAQMDERQAAEALKKAQQEVLRFVMAPDAATFDQMVTQAGRPEFAGMFDQRERLGALFMENFTDAFKTALGTKPAADNQTERDIALLAEIGIPRDRAIRITQLYVVSRDPVTGEQVLLDKSTGRPVAPEEIQAQLGGGASTSAPVTPAQAAPEPSQPLSFGDQYQNAPGVFGWEGLLKRGANAVTDVVPGIGTAFPTEQQSLADFRVLGEALVNDIASAYPRQPPSWLLQNIAELTPKPGSVWEGPDSAASKLRSLGASMQGELKLAERQLQGRISPTQRQELELRKLGIEAALNRIKTALTALEPQGATSGNKTKSGVTWSVEE